jgi:hypothetical protein
MGKSRAYSLREPRLLRAAHNPRRFRWTRALVRLLGTKPDRELAAHVGLSYTAVVLERRRRGIRPFVKRRPRIVWTESMLALLGTDTDRNVAAELRISEACVQSKRRLLGIPSFTGREYGRPGFVWTKRALALLGTAPDRVVAQRLGLTGTSVGRKRQMLGIPSHSPTPPVLWTPAMTGLLGKVSDAEVGRRFGISFVTAQRKRRQLGIAPVMESRRIERTRDLRRILKLPQSEIRARYGLPSQTVSQLRRQLGVAAPPSVRRHRWARSEIARLGRASDRQVAEALGLGPETVARERRRRGIAHSRHRWTKADRALLGRLPAEEVARRLRLTVGAVRATRYRLGIAPPGLRSARKPHG